MSTLREEFLLHYEARMLRLTCVFEPVPRLIDALRRHELPWGIVTNKSVRLARPMAQALQLLPSGAVLVGGDSTARTKPHPAPLLEAARQLGVQPDRIAYVGDDPRDMQAARAAGMAAWAAGWGYLGPQAAVHDWGADVVLDSVDELLQLLELA